MSCSGDKERGCKPMAGQPEEAAEVRDSKPGMPGEPGLQSVKREEEREGQLMGRLCCL